MTIVEAVAATEIDFGAYGVLVDLSAGGPDVVPERGDGWTDAYSAQPMVEGAIHVGLTVGPSTTAAVRRMERHPHTREVLAGIGRPVVLPLSDDRGDRPRADRVVAVVLSPGQCVSLSPGIWHAPGMGVDEPSAYYWLAGVDHGAGSSWADIEDGPVTVRVRPGAGSG